MPAPALLDRTFAALADPTRRAIVARLIKGEATVSELAKPFTISAPAISRHLRVLERAALIAQEKCGKFRRCRLNPEGLKTAAEWIEFHRAFWNQSFDRLEAHLKIGPKRKRKSHGRPRKTRLN